MKVEVKRIGSIYHGTVEGTDIDERGLTAEIAARKARELMERRLAGTAPPEKRPDGPRRKPRWR